MAGLGCPSTKVMVMLLCGGVDCWGGGVDGTEGCEVKNTGWSSLNYLRYIPLMNSLWTWTWSQRNDWLTGLSFSSVAVSVNFLLFLCRGPGISFPSTHQPVLSPFHRNASEAIKIITGRFDCGQHTSVSDSVHSEQPAAHSSSHIIVIVITAE